MLRRTLALLASLVSMNSSAKAQPAENLELAPGKPIRVQIASRDGSGLDVSWVGGTLVASDDSSLTLLSTGDRVWQSLPREEIRRVEIRTAEGKRGTGALTGGAVGFVFGFALGVAAASDSNDQSDDEFAIRLNPAGVGLWGGAMVGALGAIVGALVAPGERWERVADEAVFVGVGSMPSGGGLSLAVGGAF